MEAGIEHSRFDLRRSLGAGGFGEVYEAWDHQRDALVAVKRLKRLSPQGVRRFKHEFRSLAHLSHPNLAQLYELQFESGDWSFSMELVDGTDLLTALRRGPEDATALEYQPARVRAALRQLVRGVRALHAAGKLHRDLKPQNVLMTRAGRVVILDFGMVQELQGANPQDASTFVGTPHYMAPEQAKNVSLSPASDWYSVGVMLFELLTGEYPIEGRTVVQLLLAKQQADAPADDRFPTETPADLRTMCQALLCPQPDDRPGPDELLTMLAEGVAEADEPAMVRRDGEHDHAITGRAREIEALRHAQRRVAGSRNGAIVAITGPSGIGKSALAREFMNSHLPDDAVALTSRCWENESVPYNAFDGVIDGITTLLGQMTEDEQQQVLRGDLGALARVFPAFEQLPVVRDMAVASPSSSESPSTRRAAFESLRLIVEGLAAQRKVVILIDDAQWGDRDSAELFLSLWASPRPRVTVMLTYRGDDVLESRFLEVVLAECEVQELRVKPLAVDDAIELARQIGASGEAAVRIANESGGDPYLVEQLAGGANSAATVAEAALQRLEGLSESERAFVEILTIAGKPVPPATIRDAAAISADLPHMIARLRNERLLRSRHSAGELVEPYHDRLRKAVGSQMAPQRRVALHLRFAEALERATLDDPELVAQHFRHGEAPERSAPYAKLAAEAALASLAYERSAEAYSAALRDGVWQDEERHELQVQLGTVLSYMGRGAESAEAFVRAAGHSRDPLEAIAHKRRAAEQLLRMGQFVRGMGLLEAVLTEIGHPPPRTSVGLNVSVIGGFVASARRGFDFEERSAPLEPEEVERLDTLWAAANLLGTLDVRKGAYFTLVNARESLEAGDLVRVARTLALQSVHDASRSSSRPKADERRAQAIELSERGGNVDQSHALVLFLIGMSHYMSGEVRRSHTIFADVRRRLAERSERYVWEYSFIELYDVYNAYHLGHLSSLPQQTERLARDAAQRDDMMQWTGIMTWAHLGALVENDLELADWYVQQSEGSWSPDSVFLVQDFWRLQAKCRIALYRGDFEFVLQTIAARWSDMRKSLFLTLDLARYIALDLRARANLGIAAREQGGARSRALRAVRADVAKLQKIAIVPAQAAAHALAAQAAWLRGEAEEALRSFVAAEVELADHGFELILAAVRVRMGELQGPAGETLRQRSLGWFETRGVVDPEKFVQMLLPVGGGT